MQMKSLAYAVLLFSIGVLSARGEDTPPQDKPPVTVSISKQVKAQTGEHSGVDLEITLATQGSFQVRLRLFANPERGAPVVGGLISEQVLTVNNTLTVPAHIPVKVEGDFEVEAVAEKAEGSPSGGATAYIRVTSKGIATLYLPADYMAIRGRELIKEKPGYGFQPSPLTPKAQSLNLKSSSKEAPLFFVGGGDLKTSGATKSAHPTATQQLTLSGTIAAQFNGTTVPMANVQVQVWDSDTISPDDLLGTTTTDENGKYSINVENDDGPFGGGVDVYLYISSKVTNLAELQLISDGEGGYVPFYYAWRSTTVDDITSPTYTMNFTITNQAQAAAVWTGSQRAAVLSQQSGHNLSYVEVRYPGFGSGTYFRPGSGIINIDSENNSPVVAGHEYGHAVMYAAYGSIPGEGGIHEFCAAASAGLAWSEGFATYYGLVAGLGNGTMHWSVGDAGMSIELYSCHLRDMSIDEGRVAAGLWDLYDSANDSNGGDPDLGANNYSDANSGAQLVPFNTLVDTLWVSQQQTVQQYWTNLKARLNQTQLAPSVQIMNYNYFPNP
jgi:Transthyretin-like family